MDFKKYSVLMSYYYCERINGENVSSLIHVHVIDCINHSANFQTPLTVM